MRLIVISHEIRINSTNCSRPISCLLACFFFFFSHRVREVESVHLTFANILMLFSLPTYVSGAEVKCFELFRYVATYHAQFCVSSRLFFQTWKSSYTQTFHQRKYHSWKFLFKMNFNHPNPANSDIWFLKINIFRLVSIWRKKK